MLLKKKKTPVKQIESQNQNQKPNKAQIPRT